MKKLIALLLMILPFAGVVSAQEAKIAFVNTQEVFMAMPEVADMQKKLDELNAKYKKELETMQSEFQKKYSDFVAQQDSLTENIKVRRMQDIQDMQQRMDNFVQVAQQDVNKQQQDLVTPIQQKISDAIKAVESVAVGIFLLKEGMDKEEVENYIEETDTNIKKHLFPEAYRSCIFGLSYCKSYIKMVEIFNEYTSPETSDESSSDDEHKDYDGNFMNWYEILWEEEYDESKYEEYTLYSEKDINKQYKKMMKKH